MDKTEIPVGDRERWQNWMNCMAAMIDELRALTVPSVDEILAKYSCERVGFGMGLNVDWPAPEIPPSLPLTAADNLDPEVVRKMAGLP